MGVFKKKTETRAETPTVIPAVDEGLFKALFGSNGLSVEQAMNIPAFASAVNYISTTIATLPIKLYRETNGAVNEVLTDTRVALLNDDTGDTLDAYQMKRAWIKDYLLNGRGYIYANKNLNKVKSLHYVESRHITVNKNVDPIFKQYDIYVNGQKFNDWDFVKILRGTSDGCTGVGLVEESKQTLSSAYSLLSLEKVLSQTGGNKKGFLKSSKKLSEPAMEELKSAWKKLYSNTDERVVVLNDGIEFAEASNTPVEMQLNENKLTNSREICGLFNLSPDIVSGKAKAEEVANAFKSAIMPLLTEIKTALNKALLLESEKKEYYFEFDTKELLKGDILRRYQAYKTAVEGNFMQIDEVRYEENLPELGLNFVKLGLQDVLYNPKTKEVYTPNTDRTTVLKGGE